MNERRRLLTSTGVYAGLPLMSLLTPLLVLPVVSRAASTDEWSALTVGQSLGLVGALVIGWGWNIVGPARVAQAAPDDRTAILRDSLRSRICVAAVALPVIAPAAWAVAPGGASPGLLAALTAVSQSAVGLSVGFYCVGTGTPGRLARYEVAPRVVASLIAAAAVAGFGAIWLYPALLLTASAGGVWAFWRTHRGRDPVASRPTLRALLSAQAPPTMVEVSAGSYTMGGGFLTGLAAAPGEVAVYGSGDRLNQIALQSITVVSNALSPWVAESHDREFVRRARLALTVHLGLGLVGFAAIAAAAPWASSVLFGQRLAIDHLTAAGFGAYYLFVSLQTALARHILVSRGSVRTVLRATIGAAAVGVPLVLILARVFGATGASMGLATGELLICATLIGPALRVLRRSQDPSPTSTSA